MTIGKLSGQCDFGQKGQSYCNQRGQSCVAKRVKVAWLFQQVKCIFALKESFFDRGKRKQNIVIRSFLNRYLILIKQK